MACRQVLHKGSLEGTVQWIQLESLGRAVECRGVPSPAMWPCSLTTLLLKARYWCYFLYAVSPTAHTHIHGTHTQKTQCSRVPTNHSLNKCVLCSWHCLSPEKWQWVKKSLVSWSLYAGYLCGWMEWGKWTVSNKYIKCHVVWKC